jgi:hypothetical protein
MNFRQVLYTPILTAILWASAHAWVQGQAASGKAPFQFSCVVWKKLPYPTVFFRQADKFLPLELLPRQRSKIYKLRGQNLELFIEKKQPDAKPGYQLVGKAPLPTGTKQMLFLIREAGKGAKLPLSVFGMDDSLTAFPVGSFRFFNFTKFAIQVEFGGKTNKLNPKAAKVVTPDIPKLGGFLPFYIKDLNGNIGFQTRLFGQPRGRKIVFIVPPVKESENVSVLFLPQIIPQIMPSKPPR